jgi:hypothetical protein
MRAALAETFFAMGTKLMGAVNELGADMFIVGAGGTWYWISF